MFQSLLQYTCTVSFAVGMLMPLPITRLVKIAEPLRTTSWDFNDPAAYTYNPDHIVVAQGFAELRESEQWLNSEWRYRRMITVQTPEETGNLSSFPVEIVFSGANFDFSLAKPDGSDVRFTLENNSTLLPYWIEEYHAVNQQAMIHVRLPFLTPSAPATLWCYYGNVSAEPVSDWGETFGSIFPLPETRTILENGSYNAFPTLVRRADGSLLMSYREGAAHVSSDGRIMLARSHDEGQTWSVATLYDDPLTDDRVDLGLTELTDGTFIQPFYQHDGMRVTGSFILRSTDGGNTWDGPFSTGNTLTDWVAVYGQLLELPDGTILMPAYGANQHQQTRSVLLASTDRGEHWSLFSTIAYDGSSPFTESSVVRIDGQHFIAIVRAEGNTITLYQTTSSDGGQSWSTPEFLTNGLSPALIRANADTLILMNGDREGITGIQARASDDNGITWHAPITLDRGNESETDLGYPSAVAVGAADFLAVYYKNLAIRSTSITLEQLRNSQNSDTLFEGFESGALTDWNLFGASGMARLSQLVQHSGRYSLELQDATNNGLIQATRPIFGNDPESGTVSFWVQPGMITNGVEFGVLNGRTIATNRRFWLRMTPTGQLEFNYTPRFSSQCNGWSAMPEQTTLTPNQWAKLTIRFNTTVNGAEVLVNGESRGWIDSCSGTGGVGWFGVATSSASGVGDRMLVDDVYTEPHVLYEPIVVPGARQSRYPTTNPMIQPAIPASGAPPPLESITEVAMKNGGEITYQLSTDGGTTWFWWNGTQWAATTAGAQESSTAFALNAHCITLPILGGRTTFRAYFHSDGGATPRLDRLVLRH